MKWDDCKFWTFTDSKTLMNRPLPLSCFNCVPFLDNAYDVQTQTQQVYRLQKVIITQKLLFWNFRVFQFHKCLRASQQSYFDEKFFFKVSFTDAKKKKNKKRNLGMEFCSLDITWSYTWHWSIFYSLRSSMLKVNLRKYDQIKFTTTFCKKINPIAKLSFCLENFLFISAPGFC